MGIKSTKPNFQANTYIYASEMNSEFSDVVDDLNDLDTRDSLSVKKALFDANTILKADVDDSPVALTLNEQRILGRITGGSITGLTAAQVRTLINVEDGADVTDAVNVASSIHSVASKATPVNDDEMGLIDSAAANALKKLTWTNLKATLKTYFDTLYNNYSHPSSRQCTSGTWAWDSISGKPSTYPPSSHSHDKHTNRTRSVWIPPNYGSGGMGNHGYFGSAALPDGSSNYGYSTFRVPKDYVSDGILKGAVISLAGGDIRYRVGVHFGGAYQDTTLGESAITAGQEIVLPNTLTISDCTSDLLMGLRFHRDGGHANDTVNDTVYFIGFVFEYTADM